MRLLFYLNVDILPNSGGTLKMLLLLRSKLVSFGSFAKPATLISVIYNADIAFSYQRSTNYYKNQ